MSYLCLETIPVMRFILLFGKVEVPSKWSCDCTQKYVWANSFCCCYYYFWFMCRGVPSHVNPTWTGLWYCVLIFFLIGYVNMNCIHILETPMTVCYRCFIGWWCDNDLAFIEAYLSYVFCHANFHVIFYLMMWCLPYIPIFIFIILISSESFMGMKI